MEKSLQKFVLLHLFLVSIWLSGCSAKPENATTLPPSYPIIQPIYIDTVHHNNYVSSIQSLKNVELRARVKGYMEKIHIDEGEKVKKGQILFSISSQEYHGEVLKAHAQLKNAIAEAKSAELNLENVKTLVSRNIVSKTEQEMAEAKLAALAAKIEEAKSYEDACKLRLSYTEVKAPFDGVIDRIPNKIGSLIDEGSLLTSISDNQSMYAYFNISEKEYLDFALHLKATAETNEVSLILANNREHTYKGQIETVEGEFDDQTGSIAFRAIFPNPDNILRHGASGKVRIRRKLKNVMVVPQKSTFEIQDKIYVFVLDKDNVARMRSFTPKLRIPHLYIVESGLSSEDRIIYEGTQDVKEGMAVQPETKDLQVIIRQLAQN